MRISDWSSDVCSSDLFVNGLPLVLVELKNNTSESADIWKAYDQIQTYKEQIPDVFQYNEILLISDGSEARFGSLSANAERFMHWRTIDGVALDPRSAERRVGKKCVSKCRMRG